MNEYAVVVTKTVTYSTVVYVYAKDDVDAIRRYHDGEYYEEDFEWEENHTEYEIDHIEPSMRQ